MASIGLALAACDRAPEQTASVPELRAEACLHFGQVLSYASAIVPAGQESSTLTAAGTVLPSDVMPMGGLLVRDSSIIVFDIAAGQLVRLDPTGRVVARMGRTGRGPGEFNPSPGMVLGDFVDAHGDTIVAYDGGSVHRFTINGQHLDSRPVPAVARPFISAPSRMRVDAGVPYIESTRSMDRQGGRMAALPNRYFHVWRMAADSVETIAVLSLPQFPRMNGGGFFGSPAEARPSWDLRAGCLALMDGSTNRLVLVDVRTGLRDSLALPLPERFVDVDAANATLPADAMPQGDAELPRPALLARYVDLLIAPDGWLWIRPVFQRELWRYHFATGQFTIDTVAGFPRGFTPAGTPFRTETDDEGVTRIYALEQPLR